MSTTGVHARSRAWSLCHCCFCCLGLCLFQLKGPAELVCCTMHFFLLRSGKSLLTVVEGRAAEASLHWCSKWGLVWGWFVPLLLNLPHFRIQVGVDLGFLSTDPA